MATEIERKFLVADESWRKDVVSRIVMRQNYLATRPAVRVRLADGQGYLTIKGKSRNFSRAEYEYPIPAADAAEMLHEMGTVGVAMALLVTVVWLGMLGVAALAEKRALSSQSAQD